MRKASLLVAFLLAGGVVQATPPLHDAAWNGDLALVRKLLDKGADVNARHNGNTPLWCAIKQGHAEVVALLLDKGATCLPLHKAAFAGQTEVARLLLDNGADVNAKDEGGDPPCASLSSGAMPRW